MSLRLDIGPSGAHRWRVCTASPRFIAENAHLLPKEKRDYADEGSLAHDIAKAMLLKRSLVVEAPEDMLGHVRKYVDIVNAAIDPEAVAMIEQKVPLFYNESRNGIVDAGILRPNKLNIFDYKHGVGVSVDAVENDQLLIYAESIIRQWEQIQDFDPETPVVMTIVQPRDRNNPEPVRTWTLTRAELLQRAEVLGNIAKDIMAGRNEHFVPSEKGCQFCPAKGFCSAYATQGLVALPEEARVIELPPPGSLSREQRVKVLRAKKVLSQWLGAVESQEVSELMAGAEPAGFKLVEGKSNRTWSDIEAATKLLSNHLTMDELRPRADLISPAKAEKALKGVKLSTRFEHKFEALITKPEGKPTLVPEDDHRQALQFKPDVDNIDVI